MTDSQFASIIARALIMALRAMNTRYNLNVWVLSSDERKIISCALQGDNSPCAQAFRSIITQE